MARRRAQAGPKRHQGVFEESEPVLAVARAMRRIGAARTTMDRCRTEMVSVRAAARRAASRAKPSLS